MVLTVEPSIRMPQPINEDIPLLQMTLGIEGWTAQYMHVFGS